MKKYFAFIYWDDFGIKIEKEYVYPVVAYNILQATKIAKYFCEMNNFLFGRVVESQQFDTMTQNSIC